MTCNQYAVYICILSTIKSFASFVLMLLSFYWLSFLLSFLDVASYLNFIVVKFKQSVH